MPSFPKPRFEFQYRTDVELRRLRENRDGTPGHAMPEPAGDRPPHSTRIASSISTAAEYDQLMFFPGTAQAAFTGRVSVFDFDNAVFQGQWNRPDCTLAGCRSYVRYLLSSQRPMWVELRTN
jgi:hypothetical protein